MKKVFFMILALAMVFAMVAGSGAAFAAEAEEPVTIRVGYTKSPTTFDITTTVADYFLKPVFETLFRYNDETDTIEPWLAESFEWLDETTMQIKLYDNIYFSNGEKLTSEDVLWSYLRYQLDERFQSMGQGQYYAMFDPEKCYAIDELTFVLTTKEPFGPMIPYLARYSDILCKSFYTDPNLTAEDMWDQTCGTGPYVIEENVSGSHTTYKLRDDYWNKDAMPEVDTLILMAYSDMNTMIIDFESGALDLVFGLNDSGYNRLNSGDMPNAKAVLVPTYGTNYVAMPEYVECFNDVRVREAFITAIDWTVVRENAYGCLAAPSTSCLSSVMTPYYKYEGEYEYNPDHARELLAEAGYSDGDIVLNALCDNKSTTISCFETMQYYLAEVGITLQFEAKESSAAMPLIAQGQTDLWLWTIAAPPQVAEPSLVFDNSSQTSRLAASRITDETFNAYYTTAKYSTDQEERIAAWNDVQDWVWENYRDVPFMEVRFAYAYNTDVIADMFTSGGDNPDLLYITLA